MTQQVKILGKRFAALRRDRYLTQEEFAQKLHMSPANIRRLEQAEVGGMQVKNFRRLAELVKVSPDELREQIGAMTDPSRKVNAIRGIAPSPGTPGEGWGEGLRAISKKPSPYPSPGVPGEGTKRGRPKTSTKLPTANFPTGISPTISRDITDIPHYHGVSAARIEQRTDAHRGRLPVPAGTKRRFAVTVDGDCMEPRYRDGDVVVFSIDAAEKEGIVEGKNYFLQLADGENTFKRIFFDPDNREVLILRCWNNQYPDRVIDRSSVKILARAAYRLTPDE